MILIRLQALFCFLPISSVICVSSRYMVTEYAWKYFSYAWESQEHVDAYMLSGRYNYKNIIPVDVDRSPDGRVFVTVPRWEGVPASVHVVGNKTNFSGRILIPYPSWKYYEREDPCSGIVSVYRIAIDECNRLWVLDSGVIGYDRICPATLLAFNLRDDSLEERIEITEKFAQNDEKWGLLVNLLVETSDPQCQNTTLNKSLNKDKKHKKQKVKFSYTEESLKKALHEIKCGRISVNKAWQIYIADTAGDAIIIHSVESGVVYRMESETFKGELKHSVITIEDESFQQLYGVYGMAVSPKYPDGSRLLSFKPLASRSIYSIKIVPEWTNNINENMEQVENLWNMSSQVTVMAYAPSGILFYGLTNDTAIGCWNPFRSTSGKTTKILMTDPDRLQFISGMKFIKGNGELPDHLLLLTNRQQKSIAGTMDFEETNFRILRISVEALTRRTICAR